MIISPYIESFFFF